MGTAGMLWDTGPGGDAVPGLGVWGGGDQPLWCVHCTRDGCPQFVSPWLSPPWLLCRRACARTGACHATQGILAGARFGSGHVPQSLGTARVPGRGDLRAFPRKIKIPSYIQPPTLSCCSGLGGAQALQVHGTWGQPCTWLWHLRGSQPRAVLRQLPDTGQCWHFLGGHSIQRGQPRRQGKVSQGQSHAR